ncbi:MAG: prohibitin family protein [Lachnospiraceae bacterium]|nr:prohibitin family protein [Lachnospiraceae bacterium]
MKRVIIIILAIICGLYTVTHLEFIGTGKVGVVYSMSKGVEDKTLDQGVHFVGPFKKVKEFTIGNEQIVMTKDKREGSKGNDSFQVATADNANIRISFQMSYRFLPDRVVDTYKKFKGMNGEDIVEQRVKTVLKSEVSEVTTDFEMMDIYSGNRAEINNKITDYLNKSFQEKYGIEVIDASIIDVHPDEQLEKSIKNRITALQKKQQAKAEQETVKVEAETKLIEAENEAKVKIKKAEAEAEANKLKEKSLTEEVLKQKLIDKWDGKLPAVNGSSNNLFGLDSFVK